MSTLDRLGRNLRFGFFLKAGAILSQLLLWPFILERVDHSLFGLNTLLISMAGYFSALDIGLNSGISRYAAKFTGEGRFEDLRMLFAMGVRWFFVIGLVATAGLLLMSVFYQDLFSISPQKVAGGRLLVQIHAVSAGFMVFNMVFRSLLNGFQREDVIHKCDLVLVGCNVVSAVLVLTATGSYIAYVLVYQACVVLMTAATTVSVFRVAPYLKPPLAGVSRPIFHEVMSFSGQYFIAGLCGLVIFQMDHLVIGSFLSLEAVAVYAIAFAAHQQIRALNAMIANPIYFILATAFPRGEPGNLRSTILNMARLHIGLLIPILIIVIVNLDHFIIAWVGPSFAGAILPGRILISYFFLNILVMVLTEAVVGGLGKVRPVIVINSCIAAANLIISVVLVRRIGLAGVAIGTALPWIAASAYVFIRFCRYLDIPPRIYIQESIIPNLPHLFVSLVLAMIIHWYAADRHLVELLAAMGTALGVSLLVAYRFLEPNHRYVVHQILRLRTS